MNTLVEAMRSNEGLLIKTSVSAHELLMAFNQAAAKSPEDSWAVRHAPFNNLANACLGFHLHWNWSDPDPNAVPSRLMSDRTDSTDQTSDIELLMLTGALRDLSLVRGVRQSTYVTNSGPNLP